MSSREVLRCSHKAKRHDERLARWKRERDDKNDTLRQQGQILRCDAMKGAAERAFAKVVADVKCHRCGITQEEHASYKRGPLQKDHIIALRDGGCPSDPSNLQTLCYFCHRCITGLDTPGLCIAPPPCSQRLVTQRSTDRDS